MNSDEGIRAIMILDIIGKPAEHLIESLQGIMGEIDKEKGVKIISKEIKTPTPVKDHKDFYTTFAEIEVEVEEVHNLAILLFKYMPAHLEILSPEIIAISNNSWNDILNELARRLHAYDEVARVLQAEKMALLKKIDEHGIDIKEFVPKSMIEAPDAEEEKDNSKEDKK